MVQEFCNEWVETYPILAQLVSNSDVYRGFITILTNGFVHFNLKDQVTEGTFVLQMKIPDEKGQQPFQIDVETKAVRKVNYSDHFLMVCQYINMTPNQQQEISQLMSHLINKNLAKKMDGQDHLLRNAHEIISH